LEGKTIRDRGDLFTSKWVPCECSVVVGAVVCSFKGAVHSIRTSAPSELWDHRPYAYALLAGLVIVLLYILEIICIIVTLATNKGARAGCYADR
jgi:hypothetical protein